MWKKVAGVVSEDKTGVIANEAVPVVSKVEFTVRDTGVAFVDADENFVPWVVTKEGSCRENIETR